MNRMFFIALAIFAMVAGFTPGQVFAADNSPHESCIKECHSCASVCEKTLSYCMNKGDQHTSSKHVNALKDCISTCKTSEDFMKRGSDLISRACAVCEEACNKCAESCDTIKGDKIMQDCAAKCRECAESCKKMQG